MATLQIETTSRWDALALAAHLRGRAWYLVEPDARHWNVCVRVDDLDVPADVRRAVEQWLERRKLAAATVYVDGRRLTLNG